MTSLISLRIGWCAMRYALLVWLVFEVFPFHAAAQDRPEVAGYSLTFPAMGSTFHLSAYTHNEALLTQVAQKIELEVQRLNQVFSDYDSESELQRWQAAPHPSDFEMSDDLFRIFELSDYWYHQSSGMFDPSIGQVTHLWRKRRKSKALPTAEEVAAALRHTGWSLIKIDPASRRVSTLDREIQIDLGGIATGYTVDRCFQMLQEAGIDICLINSGGDIRCGAPPPDRDGWRIEIAGISKEQAPLRYLTLSHCAVTTSGDLWRFTEIDGVRRSHIIDPHTGYGVPGPTSVTVIADTCLKVDVLGTTLSLLGPDRGSDYLQEKFPDVEAFFAWQPQANGPVQTKETPRFTELSRAVDQLD